MKRAKLVNWQYCKDPNDINKAIMSNDPNWEGFWDTLSENLYNTVLTVTALVLHEEYGFGKKRMKEFKSHFDKAVKDATDLDYIGEHYVTLTDYAVYLNEQLGMDLNTAVINACADSHDENNSQYHMANIDRVIKELRTHGFKDAAKFLEEKIT